ncbi:MAG: GNAT family N-acetyltransferase [Acidimicrobiia bacterium]|nr:GNAT family N-acetyltransferase [Acidimicrobiia bacterium]
MIDTASVVEIEAAAYRAWPARELVEYDGWELRFADGFSRRGNSVYPARPSKLPLSEKLNWCRNWYRDRGEPLLVRQTPATEAGLDEVLADSGFTLEGRTLVMTTNLSGGFDSADTVADAPSPEWWEAAAALWEIPQSSHAAWRSIIERIDHPAAFVQRSGANGSHAAGLAVVVGGWLGLFEIIVRSDLRRRGIGSGVTRSLLNWGAHSGATGAFLQVVEENEAAIACYRRLGFEPAYHYWYRRSCP